jgi:hypothetical protein
MTQTYTLCELYEFLKMVKKFSITLSEIYNQALQEWADEIGKSKTGLATALIEQCLQQKHPGRFLVVPEHLPGEEGPPPPGDKYVADLLAMALNLNGQQIPAATFKQQALKGHFARWRSDYAKRVDYQAKAFGISWEQCYTLLTRRNAPYSSRDIEWAKEQQVMISRSDFLGIDISNDQGPNV